LQETKTVDAGFPFEALSMLGYHAEISGQPSYNGVAVLSRKVPAEVVTAIPGFADEQKRVLGVRLPQLFLLNLYVPNGSAVGSEKYAYKLAWLDALLAWLPELKARHEHLLVVGDFNIAPDDRDVHDPDAWRGQVLCSEPERARLRQLLDLGFVDTFRLFEDAGGCYTWWDYRAAGFRRNLGLRIDLNLASTALAARCRETVIDREPRSWEKPSDHAPVVARFELGPET
jgi:exodeoxyribonuclease-3